MKNRKPPLLLLGLAAIVLLLLIGGGAFIFWRDAFPPPPSLDELRSIVDSVLTSIPKPVYFIAFILLPAFGMPLTAFYLTAIPVLGGGNSFLGVVLALIAVMGHMVFCRWLALGILHPVIERLIRQRKLKIPRIQPDNEVRLVLATRLSPLPLALQNYLLALGHARWRSYLWLSLPVQGGIGVAIMFLGESALKGQLGLVVLALFLFVLLNLVIAHLRKRFAA
jgi:uncharacterized membrane protein YdjX (TVP38/TMEM64 family)